MFRQEIDVDLFLDLSSVLIITNENMNWLQYKEYACFLYCGQFEKTTI